MAHICATDGYTSGVLMEIWSNKEITESELEDALKKGFKDKGIEIEIAIQSFDCEKNGDENS